VVATRTDYVTSGPELHSVCPDHYGSMFALLTLLARRGYRRPGLLLQRQRDERVGRRQSAAFRAFQTEDQRTEHIPPLITPGYRELEENFAGWFREHQPDVVLSHFPETRAWISASSPRRHSDFVLLNTLHQKQPCAALDLQPRIIGARAVEMVVGQILRNDFGVPSWPSRTTVPAKWIEGPTVRPAMS
jgi:LacI family transcriptional regulator